MPCFNIVNCHLFRKTKLKSNRNRNKTKTLGMGSFGHPTSNISAFVSSCTYHQWAVLGSPYCYCHFRKCLPILYHKTFSRTWNSIVTLSSLHFIIQVSAISIFTWLQTIGLLLCLCQQEKKKKTLLVIFNSQMIINISFKKQLMFYLGFICWLFITKLM